MKSNYITLNQKKIHYFEWGNPEHPTIIMTHGWMDVGLSFKYLAENLSQKYHCIAWDMRGYGRSESNQSPLGYFFYEYLADLWELIKNISPEKQVILIGHSLGGIISTVLAGTHPEKISHLISLEGFLARDRKPEEAIERTQTWLSEIGNFPQRIYQSHDELKQKLKKNNSYLKEELANELCHYLLNQNKDQTFTLNLEAKHRMVEPHIMMLDVFYRYLKNITAKCLLVISEETEMRKRFDMSLEEFKNEAENRLKEFPKNSELFWLKQGTHVFHQSQADELTPKILEYLS